MGVDDLIGAIGREAARQVDAVRAQAAAEAAAIVAEAEAEGGRIVAAAPARGEAEARAEAARIVGGARLAARRELLAARQRLVDDAFALLADRLRALPATPGYAAALGRLLGECAAATDGPVVVRCRAADRAALEASARELGLAAVFEDADLPLGGVETAEGPEGRVVCRNGIAARLEAARPRLLEEAGRALFGRGGAGDGA